MTEQTAPQDPVTPISDINYIQERLKALTADQIARPPNGLDFEPNETFIILGTATEEIKRLLMLHRLLRDEEDALQREYNEKLSQFDGPNPEEVRGQLETIWEQKSTKLRLLGIVGECLRHEVADEFPQASLTTSIYFFIDWSLAVRNFPEIDDDTLERIGRAIYRTRTHYDD